MHAIQGENLQTSARGLRQRRIPTPHSVILAMAVAFGGAYSTQAASTTIDFETLSDGASVDNSYPGLTFQNATVATAGISLNDSEFPPLSGQNVAFDNGGPITITFANPFDAVEGYFTYSTPLTFTVFDSANNTIATLSSAFAANYVSSGNPPNELLQWNYSAGPYGKGVTIAGDPADGSFTLDNLSYESVASVPERTSTDLLLALGLAGLLMLARPIHRCAIVRSCRAHK